MTPKRGQALPCEKCPQLALSSPGLKDKDVGYSPLSEPRHSTRRQTGLDTHQEVRQIMFGFFPCRFDPIAATIQ